MFLYFVRLSYFKENNFGVTAVVFDQFWALKVKHIGTSCCILGVWWFPCCEIYFYNVFFPQTWRLERDAGQQQRLPEAGGNEADCSCEYKSDGHSGEIRITSRVSHEVYYHALKNVMDNTVV